MITDIKPFISKFDNRTNTKSGWLDDQENIPIRDLPSYKHFNKNTYDK